MKHLPPSHHSYLQRRRASVLLLVMISIVVVDVDPADYVRRQGNRL